MRRFIVNIIICLICTSSVSCQPEALMRPNTDGDGSLRVSICTSPQIGTKAGTEADGDLIKDIHIWLAKKSDGSIVRYGSNKGISPAAAIAADYATAEATFSNVERGDYYLYIVANLPSSLASLSGATNVSAIDAAVLPSINAYNKPPYGGSGEDAGMPLSVRQELSITAGANEVSAELLRVCGRVRITVKNNTKDKNIFLQALSLEDKNPSTGYLFHREDHSVPDIPGAAYDRPFAEFQSATTSKDYISPGSEKTYLSQYLYETGMTTLGDGLKFDIKGSVFGEGTEEAILESKYIVRYNVAGTPTTNIDGSEWYLIKNTGANNFLYQKDGTLSLTTPVTNLGEFYAETVDDSYLWKFNNDNIRNYGTAGTGMYINIPTINNPPAPSLSDTQQEITTRGYGESFQVYRQSGGRYYQMYMTNSGDLATLRSNNRQSGDYYLWELFEVTREEINSYSFKDSDLDFAKEAKVKYLNDLGEPVVLNNICRNEDVNIRVNIYYSPEMAIFYFTVESWKEDSNETTFD